jgi:hypothetical protein
MATKYGNKWSEQCNGGVSKFTDQNNVQLNIKTFKIYTTTNMKIHFAHSYKTLLLRKQNIEIAINIVVI